MPQSSLLLVVRLQAFWRGYKARKMLEGSGIKVKWSNRKELVMRVGHISIRQEDANYNNPTVQAKL
jgi:hypothetical protein